MADPKKNTPAELTEDQMEEVSGGEIVKIILQPMGMKRCAANPEHVYPEIHEACPICGCKEFTRG